MESKTTDDIAASRNGITMNSSTDPFPKIRPVKRAQTLGDITSGSTSIYKRRSSQATIDSRTERLSMRSSVDDLLLPTTPNESHDHSSSHFHSTPLLFAVLPALGGIFFENGSVVLTDICIIGLSCIFLNWSLRLPWDWYHSAQSIVTDAEPIRTGPPPMKDTILEEDEDGDDDEEDKKASNPVPEPLPSDTDGAGAKHKAAVDELNHYQVIALVFCFAGPILGAWLLHSIREQLSRPSEGIISNFNLGIFVLAAELRPTQHVFKLIQSRILYLQRTVARNPYAIAELEPVAIEDIKTRLGELEAHVASRVEQSSENEQQADMSAAVTELRKAIQPELDALNRAVRRYEKRAIALEMQVRAELQDHDQRIKDSLALAAAVTRQKKGSFMTVVDFMAAIVVLPVQAVLMTLNTVVEVPRTMLVGAYDALERTLDGRPAWLFPKRVTARKKDRDASLRRKRRE